jgi:biopolymer transport protein ExbB
MEQAGSLGFSHFLAQTDSLGKAILVIMLAMSVATWYLIVTKGLEAFARKRRSVRFLAFFWDSPSLAAVERHLEQHHPDDPFSHLAYHAIVSSRHHARHGLNRLNEAGSGADFLTRSIRRVIDEETAKLESGLTVLASVGSTAPFVGLFGTVWGVYHALVAIGLSGQGTLDRIAGPVGEALIMTALGLAVAIPAVLAYNALVRSNRLVLARLDAFAHDLFAFLSTGAHFNETDAASGARGTGPRGVIKGAA